VAFLFPNSAIGSKMAAGFHYGLSYEVLSSRSLLNNLKN